MSTTTAEDRIKARIREYASTGKLIPVLGRGVITFQDGTSGDEKLYPWLLQQLALRFGINEVPHSLHALICEGFEQSPRITDDDVRMEICILFGEMKARNTLPGHLLQKLAALSQCKTWFALGFDPFLEQALELAHGKPPLIWNAFNATTDLPASADGRPVLAYLFGQASEEPESFHLWDADAIEFVFRLQQRLSTMTRLQKTLHENNLLFIGAELSDWPLRFLLRVLNKDNLNHRGSSYRFLADSAQGNHNDALVFFRSVNDRIACLHEEPAEFASWLCDIAPKAQPAALTNMNLDVEGLGGTPQRECFFISYEHTDRKAAQRIAAHLHTLGCIVWLDVQKLKGGDDYERGLKQAVDACGFFISIVSRASESRDEGYFIKERKWAARRSESMPRHRKFYIPILIEDLRAAKLANEPSEFDTKHIERAPDGVLNDEFAKRLSDLQRERLAKP